VLSPRPQSAIHFHFESRPTLLAPLPFTVTVPADTSNKLHVVVEFIMPAMAMPKNIVAPRNMKPGVYSGTTILTMSGDWVAIASVESSGRLLAQQRFPFRVP